MRVLGIDPGTAITGYGLVEPVAGRLRAVDYGHISTGAGLSQAARLQHIYRCLRELMTRARPSLVAIEELFFNKNSRTALAVGQARGIALLAAAEAGVEVVEYTPLEVKVAVAGYGRAPKAQVQSMVKVILGMDRVPRPDDVADALAVAICCQHTRRIMP